MKKFSFLALAAAGLLTVGCSEKDEEVKDVQAVEEFKDGAFIGLSLSLPSADNAFTRANDELNNGTADEFEVKNATLYIFMDDINAADPDKTAKFVDKVSLGNTYAPDDQGPGSGKHEVQNPEIGTKITSTYNQATLISNALASKMKTDEAHSYYGYVIINHNAQIAAPTADVTTFKEFSDQAFNSIGADIAAKKHIYETGLLMTNAPICNKPGGSNDPDAAEPTTENAKYSTLVKLDNKKIFGSINEAENNPAACVYVERAAVKITVEDNRTTDGKKIGGLDVVIEGWQVINNEPTYYNTRHINDDGQGNVENWGSYFNADWTGKNTTYRFVTLLPFAPTKPGTSNHTTGYRTYFAKDVQYSNNATLDNTVAKDTREWIPLKDAGSDQYNHAYTTENTFDVAHQTWRNTTMVTLKVKIGDGTKGFFTVGKGGQTMYVDDADMTAADAKSGLQKALNVIENILKSDNDVASAMAALRQKISDNNPTKTVLSGLKLTASNPITDGASQTPGKTGYEFIVELNYTLDGAAYTTFNGDGENTAKTALENEIKKLVYVDPSATTLEYADAVKLNYYKGGVSYYNVRIKHFGDVETPWSATGSYVKNGGDGVNEIYFGISKAETPSATVIANAHKNFLGRYGVVRDNWYKLSIDQIGKIGDAEPVDPSTVTPDTPDDDIENFISVHVHIVPWVLRSQSVQF